MINQIGQHTYDIGKMGARVQLKVSLRLAPVFTAMQPMFTKIVVALRASREAVAKGQSVSSNNVDFMGALEPLVAALGKLSDADLDYIIDTCLSVVKRQSGPPSAPAWAMMMNNGHQMFDDMEMPELLQLVGSVIWHNLQGFTQGNQQASPPLVPTATQRKVG